MAHTIAKKTRRLRQSSLSETEYEEGYQCKVLDDNTNLSDESDDEDKGSVRSRVMSDDASAQGEGARTAT